MLPTAKTMEALIPNKSSSTKIEEERKRHTVGSRELWPLSEKAKK
jgi:hypothetical protein